MEGTHLHIWFFEKGIVYSNENGVPSRGDGPAIIDLENRSMIFMKNGQAHRLNGPALLTPEKDDWFFIEGEELGGSACLFGPEDDNDQAIKLTRRIIMAYAESAGTDMDMATRQNIRKGNYRDYTYFEDSALSTKAQLEALLSELDDRSGA